MQLKLGEIIVNENVRINPDLHVLLVIISDGETMLVLHVHRQMISRGKDAQEVHFKPKAETL